MKPDTRARRNWTKRKRWSFLLLFLPLISCHRETEEKATEVVSLRIAHLDDYAWQDRSQSGQPVDMKPESERQALIRELTGTPADLLVLRGLGSRASLIHLQQALSDAGLEYPQMFYAPGDDPYHGVGFLSTLPFSETRELSSEKFRIKEKSYQPLAGCVCIQTPSFARVWIWNQQAPAADDSYERRRNEARILAQTLRPLIQAGDEVLLSLHSREDADSPMLRLLEEAGLQRLVPEDSRGDSWTHRDPQGILYRQDQWIFVTPGLQNLISHAEVFDSADLRLAGPYRHQGLQLP